MKVVNKVEEKVKRHKDEIAIVGGLGLMCAAWFWVGTKYNFARMTCGLAKMFEVDPELKEHMWDALGKVKGLKP